MRRPGDIVRHVVFNDAVVRPLVQIIARSAKARAIRPDVPHHIATDDTLAKIAVDGRAVMHDHHGVVHQIVLNEALFAAATDDARIRHVVDHVAHEFDTVAAHEQPGRAWIVLPKVVDVVVFHPHAIGTNPNATGASLPHLAIAQSAATAVSHRHAKAADLSHAQLVQHAIMCVAQFHGAIKVRRAKTRRFERAGAAMNVQILQRHVLDRLILVALDDDDAVHQWRNDLDAGHVLVR